MKIIKPTDNELRKSINGINIFYLCLYAAFAFMGVILISYNYLVHGLEVIMLAMIILMIGGNSQKLNKVRLEIRER